MDGDPNNNQHVVAALAKAYRFAMAKGLRVEADHTSGELEVWKGDLMLVRIAEDGTETWADSIPDN
jgi:hypothetical protein